MAVADVFRVKCIAEGREGEWLMTWHFQELTEPTLGTATKQLAEGVSDHLVPTLRAMLSDEHEVMRFQCDRLSGTRSPNATFSPVVGSRKGLIVGAPLPASSAISVSILQSVFDQKSNGRFWVSGIPAASVTGSVVDTAYRDGVLAAFLVQFLVNVIEPSAGAGLWRVGVLSRKFLEENPGDFAGAFADATTMAADTRMGRMRSRRFGGRRRKKEIIPPPP